MTTLDDKFFTTSDVAERIGCDAEHVLVLIHNGQLEAYNIAKNPNGERPTWRISSASLIKFLESRSNRPQQPTTKSTRSRRKKQTDLPRYV